MAVYIFFFIYVLMGVSWTTLKCRENWKFFLIGFIKEDFNLEIIQK